jgi:hypothetical protein
MRPPVDLRIVIIAFAIVEGIALTAVICLLLWK